MNVEVFCFDAGRSREGAWIEIRNTVGFSVLLTQMTYSD